MHKAESTPENETRKILRAFNIQINHRILVGWLVFMAYQPFVGLFNSNFLMQIVTSYLKQFSLAWVHNLIV